MRALTVSLQMIQAALTHCHDHDEAVDEMLRTHAVPRPLLEQRGARISAEKYSALLQGIMVIMGDEMLGYGRAPHRLGMWKLMCHAVISAETLGEALRRYCHFFSLYDWGIAPRLAVAGKQAIVELADTDPARPLEAYPYVSTLFYCHRFASWLIDREIPILGVDMAFEPPFYADELRPMYRYAPLHFGCRSTRLRFPAPLLDLPLKQDQHSLHDFIRNPNLAMISRQYEQSSWQVRVQKIIDRDLRQIPSFEAIAGQLGVNPQTLRRRLRREGLEFKELKSQIRRDAAIDYLSRTRLSVEEIAGLTGFAESSNFIRAFRQWTGVTPYTYRKEG